MQQICFEMDHLKHDKEGIGKCDTILIEERQWIMFDCTSESRWSNIMHIHRKYTKYKKHGRKKTKWKYKKRYTYHTLSWYELTSGRCARCEAKMPDKLQGMWKMHNWDAIQRR